MRKVLAYIRFVPIIIFCFIYKRNNRLIMDVKKWCHKENISINKDIAILLYTYKEFRNLFIYRNRYPKAHKLFCFWIKIWYPPERTLYIECPDMEVDFIFNMVLLHTYQLKRSETIVQ